MTDRTTHRYCSVAQVAETICSHDRLVFSHAAGAPRAIPAALTERAKELTDVEIFHLLCLGDAPYTESSLKDHVRHNAGFAGSNTRLSIQEDRADFTPCFFYEIPRFFRSGIIPVDF